MMRWMWVGVTAALMACGVAWAQNLALLDDTWVTDGPVRAIVTTPAATYIGGEFSYVGPCTGNGVPIDTVTNVARGPFPKVAGLVQACVSDGEGGWFIGGTFTRVGALARSNIAHILYDGSLDTRWDPSATGGFAPHVYALALSGTTLYVGGAFTSIGGELRNSIAALHVDDRFSDYGTATDWNPNPYPNADPNVYGYVSALAVSGTTIYAGGQFTSLGGFDRDNIGAIDAATGWATGWNPGANAEVYALAISDAPTTGTTLFVGGTFTSIGSRTHNRIAALSAGSDIALSWGPSANAPVRALAVSFSALSGVTVFAGGDFTVINGQTRNYIAAFDANPGSSTYGNLTSWSPNAGAEVYALALADSTVYAGGNFLSIGGAMRNYIAALDLPTGAATAWNPNASSWVSALAVAGTTVYAGGAFTSINGLQRNNIAAVDPTTGNATTWNPDATGVYASVDALAVSGTTVYAGGVFTTIGGKPRNNIAALSTVTGMASDWNPGANGDVAALAVAGTTLYAGGQFTKVGDQDRNYVAALDMTSENAVTAWNPNADGEVNALAVSGTTVYVGGAFQNIGAGALPRPPRHNIAAVSAADGIATDWDPQMEGDMPDVLALAVSGSTVYVGGEFTSVNGLTRNHIAAIDTNSGDPTVWNPNANDWVNAIAVSGTTVYAGGCFTSIGGQARNGLAALYAEPADTSRFGNATSWNPNAGGGSNPYVDALAVTGATLYAGGTFVDVSGLPRPYFAAFAPAPTVTVNQSSVQADPTNAFPVRFTAAFSERVIGLQASDITQIGTATGVTFSVFPADPDGDRYTIQATTSSDGTIQPTIAARVCTNEAGIGNVASTSTDNTVLMDTMPPIAVEIYPPAPDPLAKDAVFTVHFSEDVKNFDDPSDVIVMTTGSASYLTLMTGGGPQDYTVKLSYLDGTGRIRLQVNLGTDVTDLAGNHILDSAVSPPFTLGYPTNPVSGPAGLAGMAVLLLTAAVVAIRRGYCSAAHGREE